MHLSLTPRQRAEVEEDEALPFLLEVEGASRVHLGGIPSISYQLKEWSE